MGGRKMDQAMMNRTGQCYRRRIFSITKYYVVHALEAG
jgi:hypothetical protein